MSLTVSISCWLKASLTQNSEEVILDKAPEPFTLICRIETPHHRGTQEWLQCGAQNYGKDIKKLVRFYTTPVSLLEGFIMWDAFGKMLIDARQLRKQFTLWQGLDVLYCCH